MIRKLAKLFLNGISSIYKSLSMWIKILFVLFVLAAFIAVQIFLYFSHDLPDHEQLANYDPPTISRVYSSKGEVIGEYAKERRIYTEYEDIPNIIIKAFIAAEDKNFFEHSGVDFFSIGRAAIQNLLNIGNNKRAVGGSTITQQVVKDFLLSSERTLKRKIKEAILAYRISRVFSKEEILELYLNQIFLGNNSYGIAAAAKNYFDKDLNEINVQEAAMLAALPKAPSSLNPFRNYRKAKDRRDWVISRMEEEGYIGKNDAEHFKKKPILLKSPSDRKIIAEDFYSASVREKLFEMMGKDSVYNDGLIVNTHMDIQLQKTAERALRNGLIKYDRKYGYRGPFHYIDIKQKNWQKAFKSLSYFTDVYELALVLEVSDIDADIITKGNKKGSIPLKNMKWALKNLHKEESEEKTISDILKEGDVILVSGKNGIYKLEQIPEVNGGIVALEAHSGKILAMVGGYSFTQSKFNRVIQANRQPGSAFKPFVYLTAFEQGYSPISLVPDEPIELEQGKNLPTWIPKNHSEDFMGSITLRKAFERSRNVATVKLITALGVEKVGELAQRLGIYDNPSPLYSMALGAQETTLLKLTNAFNSIASGGKLTTPKMIESVYNRRGKKLFPESALDIEPQGLKTHTPPLLKNDNPKVINELDNYQITSMLQGVIQRGTGWRAQRLRKTMGGKTGTTNNAFDSWFIGFTPYMTVGVYVGFDNPKSLGEKEYGSTVALPIFVEFMKKSIRNVEDVKFQIPEGIEFMEIDLNTGSPPTEETSSRDIVKEALKKSDIKPQNENTWLENWYND